jgi:hypothetical protein
LFEITWLNAPTGFPVEDLTTINYTTTKKSASPNELEFPTHACVYLLPWTGYHGSSEIELIGKVLYG